MANNTFIQVPNNVQDPLALHRFLARLVEQLDVAFGQRAESPFLTSSSLKTLTTELGEEAGKLVTLSSEVESLSGFAEDLEIAEQAIIKNSTDIASLNSNLLQPGIPSLTLTPVSPSAVYTQAEVQEIATGVTLIANKLNTVIVSLEDSKILS